MESNNSNSRTEFTDSAFVRSHGESPSGEGRFGFQATTKRRAFDSDLVGEVRFFDGTLDEAKRQAKEAGLGQTTGLVAVLP